jgi:hypothetical protein
LNGEDERGHDRTVWTQSWNVKKMYGLAFFGNEQCIVICFILQLIRSKLDDGLTRNINSIIGLFFIPIWDSGIQSARLSRFDNNSCLLDFLKKKIMSFRITSPGTASAFWFPRSLVWHLYFGAPSLRIIYTTLTEYGANSNTMVMMLSSTGERWCWSKRCTLELWVFLLLDRKLIYTVKRGSNIEGACPVNKERIHIEAKYFWSIYQNWQC